ncbi:hypothetical protein PSECIP111951_04023 [Pseudoalteromonas holothuriae]|uniref:Uncharacterized protein n=1 Tax=Pseudoalteromonas holothuriae TaxID=2963714 RepID=A0ABM9GPL7_9GAMM|nr:hypothetical protein PSECIP111951_04023 [Pseudoalteromonas sp. CIP111951]
MSVKEHCTNMLALAGNSFNFYLAAAAAIFWSFYEN